MYKVEELRNKTVYVRGCGILGRAIYDFLTQNGILVEAFIDKNASVKCVDGLNCYSVEHFESVCSKIESIFIVCATNEHSYSGVKTELEKKGFSEFVNFIYCAELFEDKRVKIPLRIWPEKFIDRKIALREKAQIDDQIIKRGKPNFERHQELNDNEIYISSVNVRLTTFCTLKCYDCSGLFPRCAKYEHFDSKKILSDIDKLLSVATVGYFAIMGGEPLIYPQINEFLSGLSEIKNASKYFCARIVTNGTVSLKEKTASLMTKLNNPMVWLSDYGSKSKAKKQIKEICDSYNLIFCENKANFWTDLGRSFNRRNYTSAELRHILRSCDFSIMCNDLHNGRLYMCPRIATMNEYGIIPFDTNAFIDIRNLQENNLRQNLQIFLYNTQVLSGCQYCDGGNVECLPKIPVAIQLNDIF